MFKRCLLLLNLFQTCVVLGNDGPLVKTKQGTLRGTIWESRESRKFYAFLGIPFAKPPLGELRFKAPVPGDSWEGIRDATKVHDDCPQRDIYRRSPVISGNEDCLYLNVYTPQLPSEAKEPLPVMIFFHGGGWLCGGGNSIWYNPKLLLDKDIILVVTNYRLGAFGFLSTGDDECPGNNGLKDQNLALKWIRDNIKYFGGNPKMVTLFGESAGGASSHYHMLSPMSKGLFNAAISESGTAVTVWARAPKDEAVRNAKKLGSLLECPIDDSKKLVECLRTRDAKTFIEQDVHFMEWDFDPMIPFKPTIEPKVEGAFITVDPEEIIKSGNFAQVPWIVGINTEDGALRSAGIFGNPHLVDEINDEFERVIPISLMYGPTANKGDIIGITNKIKEFYFNNQKLDNSSKTDVTHMYTDAWFLEGSDRAILLHRKYSKHPIYYYLFGHRGATSLSTIFGGGDEQYGVCHADELQYLFPLAEGMFPHIPLTEEDRKIAAIMTTLWTNHAKYLNPTPEINDIIKNKWETVESDEMEYYNIESKAVGMKTGLYLERAKFWRSLPLRESKNLLRDEL